MQERDSSELRNVVQIVVLCNVYVSMGVILV